MSLIVLGILLAATAIDATGCLFPLAHAVVDAENNDNWLWFLQLLLTVVQSHALQSLVDKALVFLSDRQKGLLEAVKLVFPDCPHGYCLKHLEANFRKEFKNKELTPFLWQAASATTQPEFDKALEDMGNINPKAVTWLHEHAKSEHLGGALLSRSSLWSSHLKHCRIPQFMDSRSTPKTNPRHV